MPTLSGCISGLLSTKPRCWQSQGSTSVTAEADPALLRQPTAAELRLDAQLQEERRPEGRIRLPTPAASGHTPGRTC